MLDEKTKTEGEKKPRKRDMEGGSGEEGFTLRR